MFKIRVDSDNGHHVKFTIFANGGCCGHLAMRSEEWDEWILLFEKTDVVLERDLVRRG